MSCMWPVAGVFPLRLMCLSPRYCAVLGTAGLCTAFAGDLGKQHASQCCCRTLLSSASPGGGEGAVPCGVLYPSYLLRTGLCYNDLTLLVG